MNPTTIFDALGRLSSFASAKAYADIQPVIADLMDKANSMNRDNQALAEEVAKLKKEITRFKDFRAEEKKYRPNTEDTGVVTYALKEPGSLQENTHRFCANCLKNSKVRYLQKTRDTELFSHLRGWFCVHVCHECSAKVSFGMAAPHQEPPRFYNDDTGWRV